MRCDVWVRGEDGHFSPSAQIPFCVFGANAGCDLVCYARGGVLNCVLDRECVHCAVGARNLCKCQWMGRMFIALHLQRLLCLLRCWSIYTCSKRLSLHRRC